ncbi:MAG TPA: hypothetical protein VL595_15095 [Pseudonocardia sp.]|jgi:hypothetical protein|nr:hypothetical protein [Pseudonocardia sp.]
MTIGTPASVPTAAVEDWVALAAGYLNAVANRLVQRGIFVRSLRVDEPAGSMGHASIGHGSVGYAPGGSLTLDPMSGHQSPWTPARLRWQHDEGWRASLEHRTDPGRGSVRRYLPGHPVPCPVAVAQFVVALNSDPDTVWASSYFRPMEPLDLRYLELELRGYLPPGRTPVVPGPRLGGS